MVAPVRTPTPLPVPLRPMTALDIVDGGMAALRSAPGTLLALSAAIALPIDLISIVARRGDLGGGTGIVAALRRAGDARAGSGVELLWRYPLQWVVHIVLAVAVGSVVLGWYLGREVTVAGALRRAATRALPAVVATALAHLLILAGTVVLVVPGLLAVALFSVVAPVLAVEDVGPIAAMRRSAQLTGARFGAAVGLVLLVGAVDIALTFAITGLALVASPLPGSWVVDAALEVLAGIVTGPFVAAASALLYLDLRVRSEGLDIELGAARAL